MRYFFVLLNFLAVVAFAQQRPQLPNLKTTPDSRKVQAYITISKAFEASQPDSAVHYANEGMRFAEKRKDQNGQAQLLLRLGNINATHRHTDLARRFYNESLTMFRRLRDAEGVARTYDALGLLDGTEKNLPAATQNLHEALKLYKNKRDSSGIIETYEGLGRVYAQKGDTEKALSYYLRALDYYHHHKTKPEAYFVLLENISNIYQKKGNTAAAMHYLKEGLDNSKQQALRDTEPHLLNEEGKVFEQTHDQLKALSAYKEAFAEAKRYKQPEEQAQALINIAALLKKQDTKTSLSDLKLALNIAKGLKQPQLEANIYKAMAGVYQQEKNYREAMEALEEQHRLLDSLLQADTAKDIASLDSSYALESSREKIGNLEDINRKERTELILGLIILVIVIIMLIGLVVYLRKIKRLNEELRNSNRIKDTLFSVIGHDLKGPAGSAAQLFELMETEEFTEEELRGMIAELRKQTTASLELLKALFEWGKAQLQGIKVNPSDFDPKPVIARTIHLLSAQAAQKNISIDEKIAEYLLIHADADHFEFIIRNLLSNAIKFTYNGGSIQLAANLVTDKKEVVFSVSDSGIGISKAQQQVFLSGNLNVSFGTAKEKGSGLGLMLTKDFIKANNGRIWLESQEGTGTTFYVALPVG
ncbi:tetratricopeptide repeat protein [Mucilaginibacter limnophilus]|uniref:histidine kinase n=1 Tax=Mucilaginibacter limnophilus TaxID=1932778 RepID=A0A3S3TJD6_9SPHI|nr:ATP-binding protein [Mucilaginibacter limnophilus]RVU02424.1 tetratricopeptide repeat protein [Mucilaginibacter limnophilus]